jgi:rod shape-determining protein MreC
MIRLFNVFLKFKEYFVLFVLVSISLFLLYQNNNVQIKRIRSNTVLAIGFIQEKFSNLFDVIWIPHLISIAEENDLLRKNNIALTEEISKLREASLEIVRLKKMLDFKQNSKYDLKIASVVGKNINLVRNYFALNIGSEDGVELYMPVVSEKGLIGKIINVSDKYSIVEILKSKSIRVSVINERSRISGILLWNGGDKLLLTEVAKTLDMKIGDIIKTSKYSSIFPEGIEVGMISDIIYDTGNLFQQIEVTSFIDFPTVEEVFVLLHKSDSSRVVLEQQMVKKEQ